MSGLELCGWRSIGRKLLRRSIKFVNANLIQTEIGNVKEAIIWRQNCFVSMRPLLPFFVHTRSACGHDLGEISQASVLLNGERGHFPRRVIRNEDASPRVVNRDIARRLPMCGPAIQDSEQSVRVVYGERRHPAIYVALEFAHRVQRFV